MITDLALDESMTFALRLAEIMAARSINQVQLAERLHITSQAVNQWLQPEGTTPRNARLVGIARALDVTVPDLMAGVGAPIPDAAASPFPLTNVEPAPSPAWRRLPNPDTGAGRDLPVYGTAEGGNNGAMEVNLAMSDLAVDWVVRPRMLIGVRDAFAFYVVGDSMEPRWFPGEMVAVNPARQAAPGNPVLIVLAGRSPNEPQRALFKRLVRRTATKIILRQTNPEREFEVDLAEVKHLWRVYEWGELWAGM